MPTGPHGERRPADPLANALHVAKLLTGEVEETYVADPDPGRQADGRKGGEARRENLTPERRREIAKKAAVARWRHEEAVS
ncbi:MAG: hypothetical protein OXJ90_17230 [Spirochaetaceae bacterium]|nr:hypothetical protein [Spirochaetaceae bacterium]